MRGFTPLHVAGMFPCLKWSRWHPDRRYTMSAEALLLLDAGADVSSASHSGLTPLHTSQCAHFTDILLQRGGLPLASSRRCGTPLDMAFRYCNIDQIKLLLWASGSKMDLEIGV